jgi:glutamate synthase (NADPH) small chain
MSDSRGFLKYNRETPETREVSERTKDYNELYLEFGADKTKKQAARCMDCGVPFCHNGCPLGNIIPEFNEAVYEEDWKTAFEILSETNNFPEFTGRICPAPCESACVLGINESPVAIEHIEKSIAEMAFEKGYIRPQPPTLRTEKTVAIIGSGPAGLAAAAQLNKAGHTVTVYEKNTRIGGLLRYGIPDFKLAKKVIDRRLQIMEAEGIRFKTNSNVGVNVDPQNLLANYDAVVLCGGSTIPRDLNIPGRELKGVYFAMDFLEQNNKRVAGDHITKSEEILATDKNVIVIGGGDTGADCVGTSNRHIAKSITQIELLAKPPMNRTVDNPWPRFPMVLRTSTSHEEGCDRQWALMTKAFIGDQKGNLKAIQLVDVKWDTAEGQRPQLIEIKGSEREIPCELALLAVGFLHPQHEGLLEQLGIEVNNSGNVADKNYQTNNEKIFVAGDMRRGQSLVVWAISEGREAAKSVDEFLMGKSVLESKAISLVKVK